MSATAPALTEIDLRPEDAFWDKYSRHLEFPLSTIAAILFHVVVGAFVVFVLFRLANQSPDRAAVPLVLVEPDGLDVSGAGTPGAATPEDELRVRGDSLPFPVSGETIDLPNPQANATPLSPDGTIPLGAPEAGGSLKKLDEALRSKLGPKVGTGKEPGPGTGGVGADATRQRMQRWVLRFKTRDGRDYLDQLAAMGASVVFAIPPENKQVMYFPDPKKPDGRVATAEDEKKLGGLIKFSDGREESVKGVAAALGVEFRPKVFWALFPKEIEDELDRKEKAYRNRRPEQIEQTIFLVTMHDGKAEITVYDQVPKR